ncbi:MAG: hypothetical protein SVR81_07520, partial [Chloroflexota bacterium]|nr:hypothetical protein [Chloroflexota bacterium]
MSKLDYKKQFKPFYTAPDAPALVDVPALNFLAIDGRGDPNTASAYQEAVSALYKLAYAIR